MSHSHASADTSLGNPVKSRRVKNKEQNKEGGSEAAFFKLDFRKLYPLVILKDFILDRTDVFSAAKIHVIPILVTTGFFNTLIAYRCDGHI